ncbi:MAG: cyclase family protein [Thermomicrobium sp.]|nr:cyclase family protein [Thermomicrobium sp.]
MPQRGSFAGQPVLVFDLEQPRTPEMPIYPAHRPGYYYALHRRHSDPPLAPTAGARSSASGMAVIMEHTGTHIDAPCHQALHGKLYGGIDAVAAATWRGFRELGAETLRPLVVPGVLLDVATSRGVECLAPGELVTAVDLEACCARLGVTIEPGMAVLVRTGNGRFWHDAERYLDAPGIGPDASRWLAARAPSVVGCDTMAWDLPGLVDQELGCDLPGHVVFLVQHGIPIVENLQLEELAAHRVVRFTFVCTPLQLTGATGSPVRPLAIVPA